MNPADALALQADDGHQWHLLLQVPARPRAALLWLPAMGVAARHYLPFAEALAAHDVAVAVHEWRGNGSSSLRAGRHCDWGYRQLLLQDIPTSEKALAQSLPDVPRIRGGHSLGGQLSAVRAGLVSDWAQRLWLVASGAPWWRAFPPEVRYGLPLMYRFAPWLAQRVGRLPGRRLGFAGNEARGVIRDWARTGLSGRYAVADIPQDIDAAMAVATPDITALVAADDWLAPEGSTRHLCACLPRAPLQLQMLDAERMGTAADHFAWMRQPAAIVAQLVAALE